MQKTYFYAALCRPHYLTDDMIFGRGTENEISVMIFSTIFVGKTSHSKNSARYHKCA